MNFAELESFLVAKQYKILEILGQGAFGLCYKVYSNRYHQYFACKIIPIQQNVSETREKSFNTEKDMLSSLIHPHIIPVFESFRTETYLLMILEFCPNGDLKEYVNNSGPLQEPLLIEYTIQILSALAFLAENRIVHHDIKPSNILIDKHKRIKLADFGLGRRIIKPDEMSTDYTGTVAFLAPEVIKRKPYNPLKADIWSFGITLYYIATGSLPFPVDDVSRMLRCMLSDSINYPPNMNTLIKKIIMGALRVNPEERVSFHEMLNYINETHIPKSTSAYNLPPLAKESPGKFKPTTFLSKRMVLSRRIIYKDPIKT